MQLILFCIVGETLGVVCALKIIKLRELYVKYIINSLYRQFYATAITTLAFSAILMTALESSINISMDVLLFTLLVGIVQGYQLAAMKILTKDKALK